MTTKKNLIIPIFDYRLTVIIFDDWDEVTYLMNPEERDNEAKAITFSTNGASLVLINSRRGDSIVHEAGHVKNAIWRYIGYEPMRDNDEVDQYLVTYIYAKMRDVYYKHNKIDMKSIMNKR